MEASWWEWLTKGEIGLYLIDKALLSKSLVQFSVDGWGCVPSLLFTWGQTMVEVMKIMATSFKRACAGIVALSVPSLQQATATHLLETPGHSSLGQSLVGSLLPSPGSWCEFTWIYKDIGDILFFSMSVDVFSYVLQYAYISVHFSSVIQSCPTLLLNYYYSTSHIMQKLYNS